MKATRRAVIGASSALAAAAVVTPALAGPALQQTAAAGAVVALAGTPHLWVADEQGILHWGGDTRALAGKTISWASRVEVSLAQLNGYRRGDPWLSAGLLKMGDPIYLVKWEMTDARPTLLHIQSIADVEVFGINASNYGAFVLDQAAWEQRYGMSAAGLTRGVLASTQFATPTPTPTATPKLIVRSTSVRRSENEIIETEIALAGATPNKRLRYWVEYTQWECSPNCTTWFDGKSTVKETDATDSTGALTFRELHYSYKGYTYYFEDPVSGAKLNVPFDDDRSKLGM